MLFRSVGSVVLSLSDIYLILDVSSCSVKGFGVFYLLQDMDYIVSDFAEFARRDAQRVRCVSKAIRAAIGRLRFRAFPFFMVPDVVFFQKHVRITPPF